MNKKKPTIWYCHHYAGSPSMGMSFRPYYLTQEFCAAGYNAFVIGASFHHLQHKPVAVQNAVSLQNQDGVPFVFLKTNTYRSNSFGRLLNMLSYVFRLYRHAKEIVALTGKPDVIIASSGHLFHYPVLEKLARKYHAKLIFEVRDLWPLSLTEILNFKPYHPLVLWLDRVERRAYLKANYVVSVLDAAFPHMQARGLTAERFRIIPNGVHTKLFQSKTALPEAIVIKTNELKKSGKFLLGYAGALGIPNALDYLIDALVLLAAKNIPIHCLLIGDGVLKTKLQSKVHELNLTNVTFFPAISKYMIPSFLHQMDALYLGWQAKNLYKYGVSPNKVFDYMMAGKPIIESSSDEYSLVKKFHCGIQCLPANPHDIARAIKQMLELDETARLMMGANGQQSVKEHHDYAFLAQKYMELFHATA